MRQQLKRQRHGRTLGILLGGLIFLGLVPLQAWGESPALCEVTSPECFDADDCDAGEVCKAGVVFSQNSSCTMFFCTDKHKEEPCSLDSLDCVTDDDCGPAELCTFENDNGCPISTCSPAEEALCPGFYLECTDDDQCGAKEECLIIPAAEDCLLGLCIPAEEDPCPPVIAECYVDADCGLGGECVKDPACGAHFCESIDIPCTSQADCGECMACMDGFCESPIEVECTNDFYCPEGSVCSPCGQCEPKVVVPPQCTSNADCLSCYEECLWGHCVATEPHCANDSECSPGEFCDECGKCAPEETPACKVDADCGACFGVCLDGECYATGALECGEDWDCPVNFVCGECGQCEKDPAGSNVTLCIESGGKWDMSSCGHYPCGNQPTCEAIIPGCDCGTGKTFISGEGCVTDETCNTVPECTQDADCGDCFAFCIDGQCQYTGALECEFDGECGFGFICNACGQCEEDADTLKTIQECTGTGGTWQQGSCGHYECGETPVCEAIIPGCDCGAGKNFFPGEGCVFDPMCEAVACAEDSDCSGDCGICVEGACSTDDTCDAPGPNPILCDEDLDCQGDYCAGACEAGMCVDWVCTPKIKDIPAQGEALVLGAGSVGGCSTQGRENNTGFLLFTLLSVLAVFRVRESR